MPVTETAREASPLALIMISSGALAYIQLEVHWRPGARGSLRSLQARAADHDDDGASWCLLVGLDPASQTVYAQLETKLIYRRCKQLEKTRVKHAKKLDHSEHKHGPLRNFYDRTSGQ